MSTIAIGKAEIRRVEEFRFRAPLAMVAPDEALAAKHKEWLVPHFLGDDGNFDFIFQSWILQVDGRVVLIDPCNGNGRPHPMPMFADLDTPYIERFAATGVRPDEVDYVFCTHLHHDHCGWNTQLRDGKFVPTFPKARYLFVRREYERWDPRRAGHVPVDYNVGVFERSVLPVMEAGLADLVGDRHAVSSSLSIEPAYGHTGGHSILHLASQATEAYFTGDVFHHPLQMIDPALHLGGCDDLDQAIETRRRVVALALEKDAVLIPAHFSAPHMGRLRRWNDTLKFEGGIA